MAARRGATSAYDAMQEHENEAQIDALANKVNALKGIAIHIGDHVREDVRLLDNLDGNFDSTTGLLTNTMRKLSSMSSSKDSSHMLYLVLFVVAVFLCIYKIFS